MIDGHASTETRGSHWNSAALKRAKITRFLARGEAISAELAAFAAASRARLDQIDAEHPDTG